MFDPCGFCIAVPDRFSKLWAKHKRYEATDFSHRIEIGGFLSATDLAGLNEFLDGEADAAIQTTATYEKNSHGKNARKTLKK